MHKSSELISTYYEVIFLVKSFRPTALLFQLRSFFSRNNKLLKKEKMSVYELFIRKLCGIKTSFTTAELQTAASCSSYKFD